MKKKRTLTVVAAVLAVLMLGVGYAAVAKDVLTINGTASATPSDNNFVVEFDRTKDVDSTGGASGAYTDATTATFTVEGLTAKDQTASATYTIKNSSADLAATLEAVVGTKVNGAEGTEDDKTYFDVSYSFAKDSINAGGDTTLTVTVKMLKTPVSEDVSITFPVTITATPVQPTA